MPITAAQDPNQAGAEAFAKEPDKKSEAPTLTDAETARIQDALRRGKWTGELKIGDSVYTITTLTHSEEKEYEIAKIMLRRRAREELIKRMTPKKKEGEKSEDPQIFVTDYEVESLASISNNLYWMALVVKAINGNAVDPETAREHIDALPTGFTSLLFNGIIEFNKEIKALAEKSVAVGSNVKK